MVFLVLVSELSIATVYGTVGENEAASALTDAERSIGSAYRAVLEAEQAGANVSSLLDQLNEAGQNLSVAHIAYAQGDFQKASDFANSSRNIGEEVQNAAVNLKNSMLYESAQRMWLTIIGSTIGVIIVFLGSFWVWRVLKSRYYGRVLGMKPEVSSDGSK
jgi:hypothetical protein